VKRMETEWQLYRTRFLVKAKQLTCGMAFVDALGREQRGHKGDYLVESCDGAQRIVPREFFEDVYVNMGTSVDPELLAPAGDSRPMGVAVGSIRKALVEKGRSDQASRSLIA
jgi:hypothetical protein